jgi:hypothetical protein
VGATEALDIFIYYTDVPAVGLIFPPYFVTPRSSASVIVKCSLGDVQMRGESTHYNGNERWQYVERCLFNDDRTEIWILFLNFKDSDI